MSAAGRRQLLLIGGGGGLAGRAVLEEFAPTWRIRSVHRHPVARERELDVEWVRGDVRDVDDWSAWIGDVDVVLNLAWYRWGNDRTFSSLRLGLERVVDAARRVGRARMLQVSVPPAPERLEARLPYLTHKRRIDRAVADSGLSYRIVRPTMLFGRDDRLLGVMLRLMHRYPVFPMFGDGGYHVSPMAAVDLAKVLRREAEGTDTGILDVGGPVRYRYRDLTDVMFRSLGKRPRYWRISASGARRLAALMQTFGSSLLYEYEVEWLLSDLLGPMPDPALADSMARVEPYLDAEARRLMG